MYVGTGRYIWYQSRLSRFHGHMGTTARVCCVHVRGSVVVTAWHTHAPARGHTNVLKRGGSWNKCPERVSWFGIRRGRRILRGDDCNILMGQSGPKINPVWAGDTVAEHGPVTVTSELRGTVHRALFIRKNGPTDFGGTVHGLL